MTFYNEAFFTFLHEQAYVAEFSLLLVFFA